MGVAVVRSFRLPVPQYPNRAPFPPPAHRTGRADFPHPALGEGSRSWRATPSAVSGHFPKWIGSSPISWSRTASCVRLQPRPLPSAVITRFIGTMGLSDTPKTARPFPRGLPVDGHTPSPLGLPVLRLFFCCRHAVASTPVESSRPCRSRCYCSMTGRWQPSP